jgi:hypothetical protein
MIPRSDSGRSLRSGPTFGPYYGLCKDRMRTTSDRLLPLLGRLDGDLRSLSGTEKSDLLVLTPKGASALEYLRWITLLLLDLKYEDASEHQGFRGPSDRGRLGAPRR